MDYRKPTAPTAERDVATLYVALELSLKTWLVALRSSASEKVSLKPLSAGDQAALFALIDRMQAELYAAGYREVRVVSCYEAGRDGFWLHRRLLEHGVESLVVDASSVAVPQRARRRKTDRLDVYGLLRELMALTRGESDCRVVRVPTPADEDARRLGRERQQLVSERVSHVNRIKGWLATEGIVDYQPLRRDRRARLAELRTALNQPLPTQMAEAISRALERLELLLVQLKAIETKRDAIVANPPPDDQNAAKIRRLAELKSLANESATRLTREIYYRFLRQTASAGGVRRARRQSLAQRTDGSRARDQQGRQSACARAVHRDCLGMVAPSARQRTQPMVPRPCRRSDGCLQAQDDRGAGAQAGDRAVALSRDRTGAHRRRPQAGGRAGLGALALPSEVDV